MLTKTEIGVASRFSVHFKFLVSKKVTEMERLRDTMHQQTYTHGYIHIQLQTSTYTHTHTYRGYV